MLMTFFRFIHARAGADVEDECKGISNEVTPAYDYLEKYGLLLTR